MKLATVPDGTRDGALVVVLQDLGLLARVPARVAPSLRVALETWGAAEPELRRIERQARAGRWPETLPLEGTPLLAPLPRTTSWLDGSAFLSHILLVRKARGAEPPADLRTVPLMYQGVGDPLLAPTAPIEAETEEWGIDLEAEVAVVLDDVPAGTKAAAAARHIKLLVLMNDVSLRDLIPRELAAGFGFFHGKPPSSLGPYAVTPDELGDSWRDGRLHLPICVEVNGRVLGEPDCGEMFFSFPQLVEHAAKTRPLPAGTILGSGTASNADRARGCGCLAEARTLEQLEGGAPVTPYLRFGDRVRLETVKDGLSVFGAIDQEVRQARRRIP